MFTEITTTNFTQFLQKLLKFSWLEKIDMFLHFVVNLNIHGMNELSQNLTSLSLNHNVITIFINVVYVF
jgi:hypothetical protein